MMGFAGIFLIILSVVLDVLGNGKIPNPSFLSLMLLICLGAFGWGIGGTKREWIWKRCSGSEQLKRKLLL